MSQVSRCLERVEGTTQELGSCVSGGALERLEGGRRGHGVRGGQGPRVHETLVLIGISGHCLYRNGRGLKRVSL